jgi:hypothetical protein
MNQRIDYAGKECLLRGVYGDNDLDMLQDMIDNERKKGNLSCVIHEGEKHGFYLEARK